MYTFIVNKRNKPFTTASFTHNHVLTVNLVANDGMLIPIRVLIVPVKVEAINNVYPSNTLYIYKDSNLLTLLPWIPHLIYHF
jgi:hypothetical protein